LATWIERRSRKADLPCHLDRATFRRFWSGGRRWRGDRPGVAAQARIERFSLLGRGAHAARDIRYLVLFVIDPHACRVAQRRGK